MEHLKIGYLYSGLADFIMCKGGMELVRCFLCPAFFFSSFMRFVERAKITVSRRIVIISDHSVEYYFRYNLLG